MSNALNKKSTALVAIVLAVLLLLVVMVSGIGSSSSAGGDRRHHEAKAVPAPLPAPLPKGSKSPAVQPPPLAATTTRAGLNAGQLYGSTLTAPLFGYPVRQGGCNEINAVTDPTIGQTLEIKVADTDHTLPGTNSPGPYGGCYAVHHVGGVAAGVAGSGTLTPYHEYFVSFDIMVPQSQPGLTSKVFPARIPGWWSMFESMGSVKAGPPVGINLANNPTKGGQLSLEDGYGTTGGRTAALWGTSAFTFNVVHHVVLDYVLSPCGVNADTRFTNPPGSVPCKTGQVSGRQSVTDNGVSLQDHSGTGATTSFQPTELTAGNQYPFFYAYRGNAYGGQTRLLMNNMKVGTTLASVQ